MPSTPHLDRRTAQTDRLLNEAMAHHQAGRLAEAEHAYNEVLKTDKRNIDALRLLGTLYVHTGRFAHAEGLLQKAASIQPGNPEILNNLGVALRDQGKLDEAAKHFGRALGIKPDYATALRNHVNVLCAIGNALREQGKPQEAIARYEQARRLSPNTAELFVNLGAAYWDVNQLDKAVEYYEQALRLRPDYAEALINYGTALWGQGKPDEAEAKYNEALRLQPGNAEALTCLGALLHDKNRFDDALGMYEKALQAKSAFADAEWRKSLILLASGRYEEGWKLYEKGLGKRSLRGPHRFRTPPWDGSALPGKRLLIWGEQGLGDSLQFIRYAALCKERIGKVSVLCPKPLVRLFKSSPFIDDASDTVNEGAFDHHISVMSLPHIFGTTLETVPAVVPYLQVAPEIEQKWAPKFAQDAEMKVGLVWAGNAREGQINANLTDRRRSINLERLQPFFDIKNISFVSLQMGEAKNQIDALGLRGRIADMMNEVEDFADTAAIIRNLDLVITVDTSVAHLAGALAKPVWILSRYDACWRWLGNRETSPWYPTARIFGQPSPGNWDPVIAKLRDALAATKVSE